MMNYEYQSPESRYQYSSRPGGLYLIRELEELNQLAMLIYQDPVRARWCYKQKLSKLHILDSQYAAKHHYLQSRIEDCNYQIRKQEAPNG